MSSKMRGEQPLPMPGHYLEEVGFLERGGEVRAHLGLHRAHARVVAQRRHHAVPEGLGGGVGCLRGGELCRRENVGVDDGPTKVRVLPIPGRRPAPRRRRGRAGAIIRLLTLGCHIAKTPNAVRSLCVDAGAEVPKKVSAHAISSQRRLSRFA